MTDEVKQKTASELTRERVAGCEAVVCRDRCETFTYHSTMDLFRMCVCGHSQQSHGRSTT